MLNIFHLSLCKDVLFSMLLLLTVVLRLVSGSNVTQTYARTGYLGFLRRTEAIGCDGGEA